MLMKSVIVNIPAQEHKSKSLKYEQLKDDVRLQISLFK